MRAGFAAWGPGLVLKLFSASKRYGFELSPQYRQSCDKHHTYRVISAGASTGSDLVEFGS